MDVGALVKVNSPFQCCLYLQGTGADIEGLHHVTTRYRLDIMDVASSFADLIAISNSSMIRYLC